MLVYKSHPLTYQQLKGVYKSHPSLKDGYYPIDTAWLHPQLPHHPPSTQRLDQGVGDETARRTRKTLQVGGDFWTCGSELSVGEDWHWFHTQNLIENSLWKFEQMRCSPVNLVLVCLEGITNIPWWILADWHEVLESAVFVKGWFSICAYLCHIIRWQSLSFEEDLQG